MSLSFKYNDGGRTGYESFDCTVRAYALAANISYAKSHAEFKAHGRGNGCKYPTINFMKDCHPEIKHIRLKSVQVTAFLRHNHYKILIVRVTGHVFCVRNNIILDIEDIYRNDTIEDIWIFDN